MGREARWWLTATVACECLVAAATALHLLLPRGLALVSVLLTAGVCFAVRVDRRDARRRRQLTGLLHATRRAVLRPVAPRLRDVRIAAHYHALCPDIGPETRETGVGGDLYDVADTPFGLRVIVGDVRGQGLEAAILASITLGHFRDLAHSAPDLLTLTRGLDARLGPRLGEEDFVTAVLAEFRPGEVHLVNCGHHPPIRIGERLDPLLPGEPSPPLGLAPCPVQQRARLATGDRLLLYTDGLAEARDARQRMFAWDERVHDALRRPPLDEALDALLTLLRDHTGGPLGDDLVLLLCEPAEIPLTTSGTAALSPGSLLAPPRPTPE